MAIVVLRAQEFTTPGSYVWNVPEWCTGWVSITACGAGGGGGAGGLAGSDGAGGGGGAGESVQGQRYKVTPLGTLAVVVGQGGVGNSVVTRALYPWVANIGSVDTASPVEFTRSGGFAGGDAGGITRVGTLRFLPGAGAASGSDGGSGGTGGGPIAWIRSGIAHGNMGFRVGNQGGGGRTDTTPKDSNRYFSGGGGGSGSKGQESRIGGSGSHATWNPTIPGGAAAGSGQDGAGAGSSSFYGPGGIGGAGLNSGFPGSGIGAGGGGGGATTGGAIVGSPGVNGYVLLTWYERIPTPI